MSYSNTTHEKSRTGYVAGIHDDDEGWKAAEQRLVDQPNPYQEWLPEYYRDGLVDPTVGDELIHRELQLFSEKYGLHLDPEETDVLACRCSVTTSDIFGLFCYKLKKVPKMPLYSVPL